MMIKYHYVKCRLKGKLHDILETMSKKGYKLYTVALVDRGTRYDLIFIENPNDSKIYIYGHERLPLNADVQATLDDYLKRGYKLLFHETWNLGFYHELFFEKEIDE